MRLPSFTDIRLFLKYYSGAGTVYDAHSPFIYQFIVEVLDTSKDFYIHEDIENLRQKLTRINKEIDFKELGAGSKINHSSKRNIKDIARTSATSAKDGKILFNLAIHQQARTILELGTSLGLGTSYLASASSSAQAHTIEGDPASAYMAQRNFDLLGMKNIKLHEGSFDVILPELLKKIKSVDLVYIDGDHTYEGTIKYFNILKDHMSSDGVMVLDDIYWSGEMERAWSEIIEDKKVRVSIDIYSKGFIFFSSDIKTESRHFKYIPTKFKPWRIGLFS
ncbi:MAG: class I SAM-dependent methyltransferase [Saprospiraceae bacterium]|nr:class I SAM-dependent methyltransferase [Saprospiraceae bacterium]